MQRLMKSRAEAQFEPRRQTFCPRNSNTVQTASLWLAPAPDRAGGRRQGHGMMSPSGRTERYVFGVGIAPEPSLDYIECVKPLAAVVGARFAVVVSAGQEERVGVVRVVGGGDAVDVVLVGDDGIAVVVAQRDHRAEPVEVVLVGRVGIGGFDHAVSLS